MVDKIDGYQSLGGSDKIKWGRTVSEGLTGQKADLARLRQDFQNTTASNRTTTAALSEQILTLEQQQLLLEAQQEQLTAQQAELTAQQAYQASLVTVSADIPTFNSGDVPYLGGGQINWLTTPTSLSLSVTVAAPTGRILVTYGCPEMSVTSGAGSAAGLMGIDLLDDNPRFTTRFFIGTSGTWLGSAISRQKVLDVTPGNVTVRARFGAFSGSPDSPAPTVNYREPWMSIQVIPASV